MSKPTTIPELFYNRVKQTGPEEAVLWKEHGRWRSKTWNELEAQVRGLARGISDWVEPKDVVCLLSARTGPSGGSATWRS